MFLREKFMAVFNETRYIQVETLLTFLYTLTVYRTVRLIERETLLNGFWVGAAAATEKALGPVLVQSLTSPWAIAVQIVLLLGLVALVKIDWLKVLGRHPAGPSSGEPDGRS